MPFLPSNQPTARHPEHALSFHWYRLQEAERLEAEAEQWRAKGTRLRRALRRAKRGLQWLVLTGLVGAAAQFPPLLSLCFPLPLPTDGPMAQFLSALPHSLSVALALLPFYGIACLWAQHLELRAARAVAAAAPLRETHQAHHGTDRKRIAFPLASRRVLGSWRRALPTNSAARPRRIRS